MPRFCQSPSVWLFENPWKSMLESWLSVFGQCLLDWQIGEKLSDWLQCCVQRRMFFNQNQRWFSFLNSDILKLWAEEVFLSCMKKVLPYFCVTQAVRLTIRDLSEASLTYVCRCEFWPKILKVLNHRPAENFCIHQSGTLQDLLRQTRLIVCALETWKCHSL